MDERDGDDVVVLLAAVRRHLRADHVQVPTLIVHSDGSVFPDNARLVHRRLRGKKELLWTDGNQTDFYDQPTQVGLAVEAADAFLKNC